MITTLAELISQAESSNNRQAIRFEPRYRPSPLHVRIIEKTHHCSESTAKVLAACSWGYYQIMGDNLIGLGLRTTFFDYLDNIPAQKSYLTFFLAEHNILMELKSFTGSPELRLKFAKAYNGPGEPEHYAEYLMKLYEGSL